MALGLRVLQEENSRIAQVLLRHIRPENKQEALKILMARLGGKQDGIFKCHHAVELYFARSS